VSEYCPDLRELRFGAFATFFATISKVCAVGKTYAEVVEPDTRCNLNRTHNWLCASDRWGKTIQQRVPWVLSGAELGQNLIELGSGPGLSTELLRRRVQRMTAIETDPATSMSLRSRFGGSNIEVVTGDAAAMPFANTQFSSGVAIEYVAPHPLSANAEPSAARGMASSNAWWRICGLRPSAKSGDAPGPHRRHARSCRPRHFREPVRDRRIQGSGN